MNISKKQIAVAIILHRSTNFLLLGIIFCSLFVYMFFANAAVRNVTMLQRSQTLKEILSARVSDLESKGFVMEDGINQQVAKEFGLVEVNHPIFIVKNSSKSGLSMVAR